MLFAKTFKVFQIYPRTIFCNNTYSNDNVLSYIIISNVVKTSFLIFLKLIYEFNFFFVEPIRNFEMKIRIKDF